MGIRELSKILPLYPLSEGTSLVQQPASVSLDSLQFILEDARINFYDECQIAENAFHSIDELLCRIEQKCPVNSVGFYMDGAVPRAKHRSVETTIYILAGACHQLLARRLPKVYIIDWITGEALLA